MSNTNATKNAAWNCTHCHATNVTTRCGCAASRPLSPVVATMDALNAIVLDFAPAARKGK